MSSCTDILGGSVAVGYSYRSQVQNTSFADLLADDDGNNFNFGFDNFDFVDLNSSNADGHQWEPFGVAAISSASEELSSYDDQGINLSATYSSESEGGGYSIYSDWNNTNIEPNTDMRNDCGNYSDMILPAPRIPTPSPPSSPAQPPSINNEVVDLLKRPRSPVAADLDTANILPLEHRRKRIKPARVRD